jgi:hypothetical protein
MPKKLAKYLQTQKVHQILAQDLLQVQLLDQTDDLAGMVQGEHGR